VRLLCCSPAPHGALLARDGVPVGTAQPRESLTRDSRSTVKARLIDPLRESFGDGRCARHVGLSPRPRAKTLRDGRDRAYARVRHWWLAPPVDDARRQRRACALRTHPVPLASSWLVADKRSEDHSRHAPHVGGDLEVGLGWTPATPALLCRRLGFDCNGQWRRNAAVLVVRDDRQQHATEQSRRSRYLDVALMYRSASGTGSVRCLGRVTASTTEATNALLGLLKAGHHVWRDRLAVPRGGLVRIARMAIRFYFHRRKMAITGRPSQRRSLLHFFRRLATPSSVAFATDRNRFRSLQGAGNGRTANARGIGLHAWLDDKLAMKAVSAMLTETA
jgi:hypothetical protein